MRPHTLINMKVKHTIVKYSWLVSNTMVVLLFFFPLCVCRLWKVLDKSQVEPWRYQQNSKTKKKIPCSFFILKGRNMFPNVHGPKTIRWHDSQEASTKKLISKFLGVKWKWTGQKDLFLMKRILRIFCKLRYLFPQQKLDSQPSHSQKVPLYIEADNLWLQGERKWGNTSALFFLTLLFDFPTDNCDILYDTPLILQQSFIKHKSDLVP